jgi:hypothetical protein
MQSWTMHDIATVSGDLNVPQWGTPDVVVSRTGTATVAWTAWSGRPTISILVIRTAEDPPAPTDPQDPTHGALLPVFPQYEDYLGIDAADAQTLVYQEDVAAGGFDESSDLVLSDRATGGGWSSSPTEVVQDRFIPDGAQLAVNADGASVVVWQDESPGGDEHLYASYRDAAGSEWTRPERVPVTRPFDVHVGIDDAGSVLLGYDRILDKGSGVKAIRRTPAGGWGKPRRLSGPDNEIFAMAVSAGGAAVVTFSHVDGDGRPDGPPFTSRMSPSGSWGAPVRQPNDLGLSQRAVDADAKGRVLVAGWDGTDLTGRRSRPDGRWRKPFIVAADVSKPRISQVQVVVNRRGDALVAWSAMGRVEQVWARFKLAGQEWTRPMKLTRADSPTRWFGVAVGDCGHAAIAWTTRNTRQIQVRRVSPTL